MEAVDWIKIISLCLTCLNLLGVIIVGAFNYFSHNKIVGNDLRHLSLDMQEIKIKQTEQGTKLEEIGKQFVDISARCEERHSKISYTRKKKIR